MTANLSFRCILQSALLLGVLLMTPPASSGQGFKGAGKTPLPDFIPAGYDDYQHMLDQLGIKKMRRGRDGMGPDSSNEATANPYQDTMPELMKFKDGTRVTSADHWPKRRAEIVEDFLLGKKDLGTPGSYLTDPMPPVNTLIGGELAWRQHDGGHTNGPNFPAFFEWAARYIPTPGIE